MNDADWRLAYTVAGSDDAAPSALGYGGPFERAVSDLGAMGYDGVELQVLDAAALDAVDLGRHLTDAGLVLAALATGPLAAAGFSLAHEDQESRLAAVTRVKSCIDLAAALESTVSLGRILATAEHDPRSRDARLHHARESLAELAAHAAEHGVGLLIEPQNHYCTDLIVTVGDAVDTIGSLGRPNVGIIGDTYHLLLGHGSIEDGLLAAGPLLQHVQFSDSNRGRPGTGSISFGNVLRTLTYLGYRGWITMEHRQDAGATTALRALHYISSMLDSRYSIDNVPRSEETRQARD